MNEEGEVKSILEQIGLERLSRLEKDQVRLSLLRFVNDHGVAEFSGHGWIGYLASVLMLISLVLGTGFSSVSADAIPGDPLYAVKVYFREPMQALFAFSPKARASHALEVATERLEEFSKVASFGEISNDVRSKIMAGLDREMQKLSDYHRTLIEKAEIAEAVKMQTYIESVLRTYGEVFSSLEDEPVTEFINEKVTEAAERRIALEERLPTFSKEKAKKEAEKILEETESFLVVAGREVSEKDAKGNPIGVRAKVELDLATEALLDGEHALQAGSYTNAMKFFEKALRLGRESYTAVQISEYFVVPQRKEIVVVDAPAQREIEVAVEPAKEEEVEAPMPTPKIIFEAKAAFVKKILERSPMPTPQKIMREFPGVIPADFDAVRANGGIYLLSGEELLFVLDNGDVDGSENLHIITPAGLEQLFETLTLRLKIEAVLEGDVEYLFAEIKKASPEVIEVEPL